MKHVSLKNELKAKRKARVRKKVTGTEQRPRMNVFRSAKHVYVQVIDDERGLTLASASSFEKGSHTTSTVEDCHKIGLKIAERCKAKNISQIVFDKGASRYHGRVKAIADGAREAGLNF